MEEEGRMMINDAGNGDRLPTFKTRHKIKTFHTVRKANWSTTSINGMIISDTAHQLLPGHNSTKTPSKENTGECESRTQAPVTCYP